MIQPRSYLCSYLCSYLGLFQPEVGTRAIKLQGKTFPPTLFRPCSNRKTEVGTRLEHQLFRAFHPLCSYLLSKEKRNMRIEKPPYTRAREEIGTIAPTSPALAMEVGNG